MFSPTECWALKRGQVYLVEDTESKSALLCNHLHRPLPAGYLCVPMMAQSEILGILHLIQQERGHRSRLIETKQNLAIAVAEHLAIASSSLKLRETLYNQSIRDSLTGLFNRRYLEETLKREISRAKRKQYSLGIIMIDIDHFKSFNDTFGHDGGDVLLRELSRILQRNIRREDIACRYGGEEFVLILPDASLENTQRRAEQMREAVKNLKLYYLNHPLGEVTISSGVAIYPDHGLTEEDVLRAADKALYRAKSEGRDRVATAE
jgi:diguanylate cyclase (GGDEF)-like protein